MRRANYTSGSQDRILEHPRIRIRAVYFKLSRSCRG